MHNLLVQQYDCNAETVLHEHCLHQPCCLNSAVLHSLTQVHFWSTGLHIHQRVCLGLGPAGLAGVQRDPAAQHPVRRPEHHHLCAAYRGRNCGAKLSEHALLHEIW